MKRIKRDVVRLVSTHVKILSIAFSIIIQVSQNTMKWNVMEKLIIIIMTMVIIMIVKLRAQKLRLVGN